MVNLLPVRERFPGSVQSCLLQVGTTSRKGFEYKNLNDMAKIVLQVGFCPGFLLS